MKATRILPTVLFAGVWLCSCASMPQRPFSALPGFSGMAPWEDGAWIVVHDSKGDPALPRLGVIRFGAAPLRYDALTQVEWSPAQDPPDDLESICALPGRRGEFVVAQSGHFAGRIGYLFHLTVVHDGDRVAAKVISRHPLPRAPVVGELADVTDYEGLVCVADPPERDSRRFTLLLGERGGSLLRAAGRLHAMRLELGAYSASSTLSDGAMPMLDVRAPIQDAESRPRAISDLALAADGLLWGSATEDPGDLGPFRSITRPIARLEYRDDAWQLRSVEQQPVIVSEGIKIEGLAFDRDGALHFASDDEAWGGTMGILPPAERTR